MITYLVEGALGLPVFTSGAGALYMVGPTGGYLVGFLAAATYYFHDFWKLPADVSPGVQQGEVIAFMKNIALMGCMLFLLANGTGPWSLDNRGQNAAGDSADVDDE